MTREFIITSSLLLLMLAANGCRTFNYTNEDMARERRLYQKNLGNYRGWGGGWGSGVNIGTIHPSVGGFCPGR